MAATHSVLRTKKGKISLSEEACAASGDDLLIDYARYSSVQNVKKKDLAHMQGAWSIHGNFVPLVETGRTACRGFNMQNMRADGETRHAFRPAPGYVFCIIDLDSAELRGVAQVCIAMGLGSKLGEALNAGKDVHCMLASEISKLPYEEVMYRKRQNDPAILEIRNKQAKPANFGLWGGMMPDTFQKLLRKRKVFLELGVLWKLRDAWLRTWPEANAYLEYWKRATGNPATVTQLFSGRIRGGLSYCKAANTMFQGLIADAAKAAGWALCLAMYDDGGSLEGAHIVNFPHDEFVCEVPEDRAAEYAIEIQRIVLEAAGKYLPDVPPKAEPILSRIWTKKAKPTYDEKGRPALWEPKV
jgi:DNA polymerase I-like protein with 3'-5' exonuclease and polymerase domains